MYRDKMKFGIVTTVIFLVLFIAMTIFSAFALFHQRESGIVLQTDYEIPATIVSYDSVHFVRNTRPSNDEVRIVNMYANKCTIVFGEGDTMDYAENVNMIDLRYDGRQVELMKGRNNNFSLVYNPTPVDNAIPLSQSPWYILRQALIIVPFIIMVAGCGIYLYRDLKNEVALDDHPKIYGRIAIANILFSLGEIAIFVFKLLFH